MKGNSKKKKNTSKKNPILWVPVVIGCLKKKDHLLVGMRPENDIHYGAWEFPGGKIKKGENPEEALKRELKEEINILVSKGSAKLKLSLSHSTSKTSLLLLFYTVSSWKGEMKPFYHAKLKWVKKGELYKLSLIEANKKNLNQIISCL